MTTFFVLGSAKTMEVFLGVVIFMAISMLIQGIPLKEVMETVTQGIKRGLPAVTLLALAYSVNALSSQMGTANFIIVSIMAFATGSSWGTFAICMPIALPLAFAYTDGQMSTLIVACFAAVAGGGAFGDHCSPLSNTTILASTGAGADHIDHVKTQIHYALLMGGLALRNR